jgi:hypothetical protein
MMLVRAQDWGGVFFIETVLAAGLSSSQIAGVMLGEELFQQVVSCREGF